MPKDYSFTFTSKPVNATASRVMSRGEECPIEKKYKNLDNVVYQEECPPIEQYIGPDDHNLTGHRYQKLTVVGYGGKATGNSGYAKWVCKCSCGIFVIRRSKTLKRLPDNCCDRCKALDDMRSGKYGKNKK